MAEHSYLLAAYLKTQTSFQVTTLSISYWRELNPRAQIGRSMSGPECAKRLVNLGDGYLKRVVSYFPNGDFSEQVI
jgi:hypothetical protein